MAQNESVLCQDNPDQNAYITERALGRGGGGGGETETERDRQTDREGRGEG